jgi:hypothetical protein
MIHACASRVYKLSSQAIVEYSAVALREICYVNLQFSLFFNQNSGPLNTLHERSRVYYMALELPSTRTFNYCQISIMQGTVIS